MNIKKISIFVATILFLIIVGFCFAQNFDFSSKLISRHESYIDMDGDEQSELVITEIKDEGAKFPRVYVKIMKNGKNIFDDYEKYSYSQHLCFHMILNDSHNSKRKIILVISPHGGIKDNKFKWIASVIRYDDNKFKFYKEIMTKNYYPAILFGGNDSQRVIENKIRKIKNAIVKDLYKQL